MAVPRTTTPKRSGQYAGAARILGKYWRAYGGWRAIVGSPYSALALIVSAAGASFWRTPGWWDTAIAVLPNLLGFSLGAYAMLVSFGDDKFKRTLGTPESDGPSAFISMSASFAHFIVVQSLAVILAVLSKVSAPVPPIGTPGLTQATAQGLPMTCMWGVGFFLFSYSLALTIATAMAVFRLTNWFNGSQLGPENSPAPPHGDRYPVAGALQGPSHTVSSSASRENIRAVR